LIIDSASAFYWPDRLAQELSRFRPSISEETIEHPPNLTPEIITSLKNVQLTFTCPLIYTTKQGLNPFPANFATLTLRLERVPVPRFPPFMSLEEACGREKDLRWQEVVKGRFSATVVGGSMALDSGDTSGERPRWLGFKVTDEGIEIEMNDVGE
jgi:hypothetical protein